MPKPSFSLRKLRTAILALVISQIASTFSPLLADDERRFGFVYQATTEEKGGVEIENWAIWLTPGSDDDGRADRFDFRHELEFGLTDNIQLGIYVADWSYRGNGPKQGARYDHSAAELIWKVTDPEKDFIGSALYSEVQVGDRFVELEGKFILQKNMGPFVIAYNATLAAEWEGGGLSERNGELEQSLGVSWEVVPSFSIGAEFLQNAEIRDWSEVRSSAIYLGPNASFRHREFYMTITPLIQLTDRNASPDFQTRVIFGFGF
jgi:hypothetical protein